MGHGPQFSNLLKELRRSLGKSQSIGRVLGLGNGAWQSYEQGSKLPSIQNLFLIADRLAVKFDGEPVPSQAELFVSWLEAQDLDIDEDILRALRSIRPPRASLTEFSWLRPITFTGERREQWARTRLDCLIGPAAISALRWFDALGLGRDNERVPDKDLTAHSWDDLVERYGDRDIVSISSGAVNAMTGMLNDALVFRFDAVPEARTAYRAFIREMPYLESEIELRAFQQCLVAADRLGSSQDPAVLLREAGLRADDRQLVKVAEDASAMLGGSTPSQFTAVFRQAVVDPFQCLGFQSEKTFDYGVVSFARHPFGSEDRIALVIAGTNGIATAGAVKLLASGGMTDRPLGAVVRVRVRTVEKDGRNSFELVPEVVTPPYEPDGIVRSIDGLIESRPVRGARTMARSLLGNWSDDDLVEWKGLVVHLSEVLANR